MSAVDALACVTYEAMIARPPHVALFKAVRAAEDADAAAALLRDADPEVREAALRYAAEPEAMRERERRLAWMRADARRVAALKVYYREHVADFIADWMTVTDPRRVSRGLPALVPLELWPKQRELVSWLVERVRTGTSGAVLKSRDTGVSTVCMATLAALCVMTEDFRAGVLSDTEQKIDRFADTLLQKLRGLLRSLPSEFAAGYDEERTSMYLSVSFPETRSTILGATGGNAFRGSRLSCVVVDEAGFLQDARAIDSALSAVTDVRLDVSTPNGVGNPFFERCHNDHIAQFRITYRDDPRKDDAWLEQRRKELDPVVFASEILADFYASIEGVLIPPQWAAAAVGLAERLGLEPSGARVGALDVADLGKDRCALAVRHGISLLSAESWSGAGSDVHATTARAFRLLDEREVIELVYDATGVGSGVRAAGRVLNESRQRPITLHDFVAGAAPLWPERPAPRTSRKNKDLFLNRATQAAWHLRQRFEESFKAASGEPYDAELLISIDPRIPELSRLLAEISQPVVQETATGKLQLDKAPNGARSPNLFDCVSYCYAPRRLPLRIGDAVLEASNRRDRQQMFVADLS